MAEEELLEQAEKGFSRRYRFSLWWVEHRDGLRRLMLILWGTATGLVLVFAAWTMVDTFLVSYDRETTAVEAMAALGQADLNAFTRATAARPLGEGVVSVFSAGEGRYDFHAGVSNPNADWWAEFTYRFVSEAGTTPDETAFILPGDQEKPIVAFAFSAEAPPRAATLEIDDLVWYRVDHHLTRGPYEAFARDRLNVPITDVAVLPEETVNGTAPPRVSFTVENRTAFGYYDPTFYVLLKRGPLVVGVNRAVPSSLRAGETQAVRVNWFGPMPAATSAEVFPSINIFDPAVYQPATP